MPACIFAALFHQPNSIMRIHHLAFMFLVLCLTACQQVEDRALASLTATSTTGTAVATTATANIVFQSTDGGQTWQDISAGLPVDTKAEGFFVGEGELLLTATDGVYRSSSAAKSTNWEKEMFLRRPLSAVSVAPAGTMAISDNGRFFQKLKGTDVWMPIFTDFKNASVRTAFNAKDGSTFIGSDDGLFKSTDQGKTWKHVMKMGWVIKMVESDGVLLCTNEGGILRSTDGGETWDVVLYEGGVGIDLAVIKDGFAAITYNTETEIRRVRTSADGGKTWQAIDAGLPPTKLVSTIRQMGNYFYCGHPDGIYRTADRGKTWELLLPTIGDKVFDLSISEGVMYAVLKAGGC
jgi:photosystem II stability/assembly factor-like uncharacterized protein